MFQLFKVTDAAKCGGCNWDNRPLYVFAKSQTEADLLYLQDLGGLCGDCIAQLLIESETQVQTDP